MKTLFFFFLILVMGCSAKEDFNINSQLLGKWKWVESSGGIDGRTVTPESTGNIIYIEFTLNTVKKYVNGELESELNYEISLGESIRTNSETELIIYKNVIKQSIKLANNTLILYDECYDCFQNNYIRE